MNDTSPEMEQLQFEMMAKLGPRRRTELACEMYMAARASALASLPLHLTKKQRRNALVEKMYGFDFAVAFFNDEVE